MVVVCRGMGFCWVLVLYVEEVVKEGYGGVKGVWGSKIMVWKRDS